MKRKTLNITRWIELDDYLDVMIQWGDEGQVQKFALNYRAWIDGTFHQIYRIDDAHGYLHEQRFWISSDPIPLPDKEALPKQDVIHESFRYIYENYKRLKGYYKDKLNKTNK